MRSALGKIGIEEDQIEIEAQEPRFAVKYDKSEVDPDKILATLKEAGEPAKKVD